MRRLTVRDDRVDKVLRASKCTKGVRQTRVCCSGIDKAGSAQLPNASQPLHGRAVEKQNLQLVEVDVTMDRIGEGLCRLKQILAQAPRFALRLSVRQSPSRHRCPPRNTRILRA